MRIKATRKKEKNLRSQYRKYTPLRRNFIKILWKMGCKVKEMHQSIIGNLKDQHFNRIEKRSKNSKHCMEFKNKLHWNRIKKEPFSSKFRLDKVWKWGCKVKEMHQSIIGNLKDQPYNRINRSKNSKHCMEFKKKKHWNWIVKKKTLSSSKFMLN